MPTLKGITDDVLERLDFDSSVATSTPRTRINRYVNEWHRQILGMSGMDELRRDLTIFASVNAQYRYALPFSVQRVHNIYDRATGRRALEEVDLSYIEKIDPGRTASAPAQVWAFIGYTQTRFQPGAAASGEPGTTGTGLWIASDAAGDNTQTARIETVRANGISQQLAAVSLNGTTRVQFGTFTDHVEIIKCSISATAVGTITVYDAGAAGTALLVIPIGFTASRYFTIQLWPTPTDARNYIVDYTRRIFDMVNAQDEPLLPEDFHYLLGIGARISEYEKKEQIDRADRLRGELKEGLSKLRMFMVGGGRVIIPGTIQYKRRFSRLGPFYPPGS